MINVLAALKHLNIRTDTESGAVYDVRTYIEASADHTAAASKLIHDVIDVDTKFDNPHVALKVAQILVAAAVKAECVIDDAEVAMQAAIAKAKVFVEDPKNRFHFIEPEASTVATTAVQVVADLETKVEVKADGTMKKGGKEVLAKEMYAKRVVPAPETARISNQEFIAMLMKELSMSKPGATTYAYNCDKALGGHLKVESERRKAEEKVVRDAKRAAEAAAEAAKTPA